MRHNYLYDDLMLSAFVPSMLIAFFRLFANTRNDAILMARFKILRLSIGCCIAYLLKKTLTEWHQNHMV